ncbi:High-affinity nicotinic acid transporter [Mycena kentingensis (nom. inval.)]|nr:High-affinity nicotinic acid transporter [Mycena kentingensis (nom. inval.)]
MEHDKQHDDEKPSLELSEDANVAEAGAELTEAEKRRVVRRLDIRLVGLVGLMYCVSLVDRTNLSSAAVAGMSLELVLTGFRYNIISLVFFPSYIVFQPAATVFVRKIGPRLQLSLITFLWGCLVLGMGFVKTWNQMAALRVVLGILEAGFFPCCIYLLSTWYTRYELGKRNAIFYLIASLSSAFAGIMAYGIQQMDGLGDVSGWRWIFVIEGLVTVVVAGFAWWLLVDFPDSTRQSWNFLTERERKYIVDKVNADRGDVVPIPFRVGSYLKNALDWKLWVYAMLFFNTTTVTYALAFFLPIILRVSLGYSVADAQLLSAPPFGLAAILMYTSAYLGDRYRLRGPIIIFNSLLCLIGLPLVGFHPSPGVRYFGIFLTTAGANSNVPAVMSYQANNIRGQWKRAFASASFVGMGGCWGDCGEFGV